MLTSRLKQLASLPLLVLITSVALPWGALASAADLDATASVSTNSPVLGRILQKSLAARQVQTNVVQWAHVPERGVVFLLNAANVRWEIAQVDASTQDIEWENARRDLAGRVFPAVKGQVQVNTAIDVVARVLQEFESRLPLPSGESVRVVLYQDASSRQLQQLSNVETANELKLQYYWRPTQRLSEMTEYVVIDRGGRVGAEGTATASDVRVLARVLSKKLRESFPREFWGEALGGVPGLLGVDLGDWGAMLALNMTFPLSETLNRTRATNDLWAQAVKELQAKESLNAYVQLAEEGSVSQPKTVNSGLLVDTIKGVMADFGARVRGLDPEKQIIALVYDGMQSVGTGRLTLPEGLALGSGEDVKWKYVVKQVGALNAPRKAARVIRASGALFHKDAEPMPRDEILQQIEVE